MNSISYKFDKWNAVNRILLMGFICWATIHNESRTAKWSGHMNWFWIIAPCSITVFVIFFDFFKYVLPAFKNKIALEIDDEKLQSYIDKKTIYWKDVEHIKFANDLTDRLVFILKDKKKIKISLYHIKGGHTDMFNMIESHYNKLNNTLS